MLSKATDLGSPLVPYPVPSDHFEAIEDLCKQHVYVFTKKNKNESTKCEPMRHPMCILNACTSWHHCPLQNTLSDFCSQVRNGFKIHRLSTLHPLLTQNTYSGLAAPKIHYFTQLPRFSIYM